MSTRSTLVVAAVAALLVVSAGGVVLAMSSTSALAVEPDRADPGPMMDDPEQMRPWCEELHADPDRMREHRRGMHDTDRMGGHREQMHADGGMGRHMELQGSDRGAGPAGTHCRGGAASDE